MSKIYGNVRKFLVKELGTSKVRAIEKSGKGLVEAFNDLGYSATVAHNMFVASRSKEHEETGGRFIEVLTVNLDEPKESKTAEDVLPTKRLRKPKQKKLASPEQSLFERAMASLKD